jgi:hypothetical protein
VDIIKATEVYKIYVDWIESAVFDLLLLGWLQYYEDMCKYLRQSDGRCYTLRAITFAETVFVRRSSILMIRPFLFMEPCTLPKKNIDQHKNGNADKQ